jgi:hypothetical protein
MDCQTPAPPPVVFFHHVLKLLGEVSDRGGLLLEL